MMYRMIRFIGRTFFKRLWYKHRRKINNDDNYEKWFDDTGNMYLVKIK